MHLAGEADGFDFGGFGFRFGDNGFDRGGSGLPPILRVLLSPEWLGGMQGIRLRGFSEDFAFFIDEDRLGGGGADIDAEEITHEARLRGEDFESVGMRKE